MRRLLLATALFAATSPAIAGNFTLYPGFTDPKAFVEMTTDKGLIVEIVLRCRRKANGQISAGIMTYSKVDRKFCSSRNRCYFKAERAADETCGY
ncbi:MAG: hypothetical protein AAFU56_06295 [Pseudomonadota bacterium]